MDRQQPVIVYHAGNEMEAQLARDILLTAGIPVLHLPGLSTGIWAIRRDLRVAVPEAAVDEALELLRNEGLDAAVEERARGAGAVDEAVREAIPRPLRLILLVVLVGMFLFTLLALLKGGGRPLNG
jgi:hypothetical protein